MAEEEEIDLKGDPAPRSVDRPTATPYDPTRDRETKRGWIAMLLIALLVAIVVMSFGTLWWGVKDKISATDLKDFLAILIGPVVGLVGTVAGFYFGEKSKG